MSPFLNGNGEVQPVCVYFDKNYAFDSRARLSIRVINEETKKSSTIPLLLIKKHPSNR
jgi:hypothetical protein